MTQGPSSTSVCECCNRGRCNKTLRIPVTSSGGQTKVIKVCGRCVVANTQKLHDFILKLQKEMEKGPVT